MPTDLYQASGHPPPSQQGGKPLQSGNIFAAPDQFGPTFQPNSDTAFMPKDLYALKPYKPAFASNWLAQTLHHATGGLSDKVDAAAQAVGVMPGGVPGEGFSDRYHKNLTNVRNAYSDYATNNPTANAIAEGTGMVAPMLATDGASLLMKGGGGAAALPATVREGVVKEAFKRALQSAGTGAKYGATYGLGSTNDDSLSHDIEATLAGAITGGTLGAAAPFAVQGAGYPFRLMGRGGKVLGSAGQQQSAGRILNAAAGSDPTALQGAPLHGMSPTLGQSTNNPGLLWLEQAVQKGTPEGEALAAKSKAASNDAILNTIGQVGDTDANHNQAMYDALEKAHANVRTATRAAWKAANIGEATGIPTSPLKQAVGGWYNGLTKVDQSQVPNDILEPLSKFGPQESLDEIQSLRSLVGGKAAAAARAGDANTARILGGARDAIDHFMDNLPDAGSGSSLNIDPSVVPAYNAARTATKEMHQTFSQPAPIRNVLAMDSHGGDKVAISDTANQFIKPSKPGVSNGAPEAFTSYLNAIRKGGQTQEGMKAARDAFASRFMSAVTTTDKDIAGNPTVSRASMSKFVDSYAHVINSPIFSTSQRDLIRSISDAADMSARSASFKGSPTFPNLQGQKFLDVLIGPGASHISTVVGAGVGMLASHVAGEGVAGSGATIIGFMAGAHQANNLLAKMYSAPRDNVVHLITEAMHDPALAKALMYKASQGNWNLVAPKTKAKIIGILSAQPAGIVAHAVTNGTTP